MKRLVYIGCLSAFLFSVIFIAVSYDFTDKKPAAVSTSKVESSSANASISKTQAKAIENPANQHSMDSNKMDSNKSIEDQDQLAIYNPLQLPEEALMELKNETGLVYRPLFDQLGLDPDKQSEMNELLFKTMSNRILLSVLARTNEGTFMIGDGAGGTKPLDPISINRDRIESQNKMISNTIQELLTEEQMAKYQYFEASAPERSYVNEMKASLVSSHSYLDPEQEQLLIDRAYDLKKKFPSLEKLMALSKENPASIPDELKESSKKEHEQYLIKLQEIQNEILTPNQIEVISQAMRSSG